MNKWVVWFVICVFIVACVVKHYEMASLFWELDSQHASVVGTLYEYLSERRSYVVKTIVFNVFEGMIKVLQLGQIVFNSVYIEIYIWVSSIKALFL